MSTGREIKASFKKAAVWGQAVACGQNDLFLLTSEKITRDREHLPDDSAGQAWVSAADQGLITCAGQIEANLRYQGLETLLAMVMGAAGAPLANGDGTYTHRLAPADHTDGLFGTLAIHKGFSVHQYASTKIDGFSISGKAGQPLSVSFNAICDDRAINTTSGANTVAAMEALDAPLAGGRVLFRHARFLLNDVDGPALDADDEIRPSGFTLGFKRKLAGEHLAGGDDAIAEPTPTGFPELSLDLEFPVYTSDVFLHDLGNDTRKKLSITFSGGVGQGLTLTMPHVVLTNAEASVNGAGKITHPVSATLLAATSAPAGMSGQTGPLYLTLINGRSSDALA